VAERLSDRILTRPVARAMTSPSGVLVAGAGAALAILGGVPIVGVAAIGVACWAGRVALALPRRGADERIRPGSLSQPWRSFVTQALSAQDRFQRPVRRTRPGPLRDHLDAVGRRLDDGVSECWRIARQGDALDRGRSELRALDVQAQLDRLLHAEPPGPARDRAEHALRAQLSAAQRMEMVAHEAGERLLVLNAQLDEVVARAVELSLAATDATELGSLPADVDSLVGELEAVRQGLEEAGGQAQVPDAG
jgi:hypothetical protein